MDSGMFENSERLLRTLQGNTPDIKVPDAKSRIHDVEFLTKEARKSEYLLDLYTRAPELTDKGVFDYALDIAVKLTESVIGFFHQVAEDQKHIILTTWNDRALDTCTTVYDNHYSIDKAGNWVDTVRYGHPIVYNDFPNSPNQKGLPDGHTPITRFMSTPVTEGDRIWYIFGVGNKPSDYDQYDVNQLQAVAYEMQKIIMRREVLKELDKYKNNMETLVRERTEELERMVQLMSGREIRMAELKSEISRLKAMLQKASVNKTTRTD